MVDRLILEELRRAPAHGYAISTAPRGDGSKVTASSRGSGKTAVADVSTA